VEKCFLGKKKNIPEEESIVACMAKMDNYLRTATEGQ
jgi:hypothetical protein